jgi:hypothetical protein
MSKLTLVPQEVSPPNSIGLTPGYGVVRFQRENAGKITEKLIYNPPLWDALRAKKKSSRQKALIEKAARLG